MAKKRIEDLLNYDVTLIDAMNAIAISYYFYTKNKQFSYNGKSTGMLYGIVQLVFTLRARFTNIRIAFLWEGYNSMRKARVPLYKSNRKKPFEDEFLQRLRELKEVLPYLGVEQISHVGLEADDLAGYFSDGLHRQGRRVLLVSNDRDWWQFARDGDVAVDLFIRNQVLTYGDLQSTLGYPPEKVGLWKVLKGDKSDAVPGLLRFPTALALRMVRSCSSCADFKTFPFTRKEEKWRRLMLRNWDTVIERNAMLVLYHPEWINSAQIVRQKSEIDADRLKSFLRERGCFSLLRRMQL